MHAALTLADRIGVTVPLASHVPYTRRIIRSYGMERFVSGMLPIGVYGKDTRRARQEIFDITVGLIRKLVDETGAEIILPLGGALIPYVVDTKDLEKAAGVPVLNTKAIGIRFAEICVSQRMTQSPLTYPRAKLHYEDFVNKM